MTNSKQTIEVRKYNADGKYIVVETIQRKCWFESIGNFNPMFCRYKGANPANVKGANRWLVNSDMGDISDPFRAEESYLTCLFIKLPASHIALPSQLPHCDPTASNPAMY